MQKVTTSFTTEVFFTSKQYRDWGWDAKACDGEQRIERIKILGKRLMYQLLFFVADCIIRNWCWTPDG